MYIHTHYRHGLWAEACVPLVTKAHREYGKKGSFSVFTPPKNPREGVTKQVVPLVIRALRGGRQVYVRNLTAGTLTESMSCHVHTGDMYVCRVDTCRIHVDR